MPRRTGIQFGADHWLPFYLLFVFRVLKPLSPVAMSWDSYIDNLIAQSKDASGGLHVDKACIIGLDGGAKWTTDGHASAYKVG